MNLDYKPPGPIARAFMKDNSFVRGLRGPVGSGKSVAVNAMILSLVYNLRPDECKFIMIDPKMLELSVYEDIPYLLHPVVTDPRKAVYALKWTVREMNERYKQMSILGVRNIDSYNKKIDNNKKAKKNFEGGCSYWWGRGPKKILKII